MVPNSAVELVAAMFSKMDGANSGGKSIRAIKHHPMVVLSDLERKGDTCFLLTLFVSEFGCLDCSRQLRAGESKISVG